MERKRLVIKIYGEVIGVSFRYYTRALARSLHLAGYVKNLPDMTVIIVAEGLEGKLQDLLEWARHGPGWARVEKVEFQWAEDKSEFKDFRIDY